MSDFTLNAEIRHDLGKGASRRLRRANQQVPAVVYGGTKEPQSISVEKNGFYKAIEDESFFSSVITLDVEGKKQQVVVRDLQRHPFKPLVTHADFLRINAKEEITMNVPLHVSGEDTCVGIKDQDGELYVLANDVAISCLPKDLPDYLEIDISAVEVGTTLHLSDLHLPTGVTSVDLSHGEDHDTAILSVKKKQEFTEEEEDGEANEGEADGENTEGDNAE